MPSPIAAHDTAASTGTLRGGMTRVLTQLKLPVMPVCGRCVLIASLVSVALLGAVEPRLRGGPAGCAADATGQDGRARAELRAVR
jgi:hypothetical protein